MIINVMGATGQLGRRIVDSLIEQGVAPANIIASARTVSKAAGMKDQGIQVRHADYEDVDTMREAFSGSDVVILIPSTAPVEPRILQHQKSLQAAKEAQVGRLLFVSLTTAGFLDSKFEITPYLIYAEMKLRQSRIPWTILRNTMYLDAVGDWMPELVEMKRLPYPVKEGRVAFAGRDDLARAIAAASIKEETVNQIYELTGPESLSMPALAAALSDVTGESIRFDSITDEDYAEICRQGHEDVPEPLIRILTSIYWAVENGEFGATTNQIEALTGTSPLPAKEYLKLYWDTIRANT